MPVQRVEEPNKVNPTVQAWSAITVEDESTMQESIASRKRKKTSWCPR
jgi:hypothetical protein